MTTWVEVIERENTITIDGYTSNKTERGIIKDVARIVAKYDKDEADALLECLKMGLDEYNTPFLKASESEGGYFFEYEEMPATRYNEETDEVEYKDGYHNYFCIRIVKKQEEQEIETETTKITAHTYVCELPEAIQNQIIQECEETFKSLAFPVDIEAELDNVKGCKMCDIEDTINVQKYYTK